MGRPKKENKKGNRVVVRLDDSDKRMLEGLMFDCDKSASDVIRVAIRLYYIDKFCN